MAAADVGRSGRVGRTGARDEVLRLDPDRPGLTLSGRRVHARCG
jgi:hypothetical protein